MTFLTSSFKNHPLFSDQIFLNSQRCSQLSPPHAFSYNKQERFFNKLGYMLSKLFSENILHSMRRHEIKLELHQWRPICKKIRVSWVEVSYRPLNTTLIGLLISFWQYFWSIIIIQMRTIQNLANLQYRYQYQIKGAKTWMMMTVKIRVYLNLIYSYRKESLLFWIWIFS